MTALTFTETLSREMTSWGGTSMTTVRRSTLTICCAAGKTRKMPGPLTAVKRPKVKITPRSYSFNTLKALNSINAAMTTTTIMPMPMSISLSRCWFRRLHYKLQAVPLHHPHGIADAQRCATFRIPYLAVYTHLALTLFIEVLDHAADGAEQLFRAADDGPAPGAHGQCQGADHQQRRGGAETSDETQGHAEPGHVVVHQDQGPEYERQDAADAEGTVGMHE